MILDSLAYLLDMDTKGVDKGLKEADKAMASTHSHVNSLQGELDKTSTSFTKAGSRAGTAALGIAGLTAALGALAVQLVKAATNHTKYVSTIDTLAEISGVARGTLDTFGKVIRNTGGDAMAGVQSMVSLGDSIGKAINYPTKNTAKTFEALGVQFQYATGGARDITEVLLEVSDSVKGLDKVTAKDHLSKLGITDPNTVALIMRGSKAIRSMTRDLDGQREVSQQAAEAALRFQAAEIAWTSSTEALSLEIKTMVLEALKKLLDWAVAFGGWVQENKEMILGAIGGLGVALTILAIKSLPLIIGALGGLTASLWATFAAAMATFGPFILIGAAIGFLIKDLRNFDKGADSIIGKISNFCPIVGAWAKAIIGIVKAIAKVFKGDLKGAWKDLVAAFTIYIEAIFDLLIQIGKGIGKFFDNIANFVSDIFGKVVDGVKNYFIGLFEFVVNIIKGIFGKVIEVKNKILSIFGKGSEPEVGVKVKPEIDGVSGSLSVSGGTKGQIGVLPAAQQGLVTTSQSAGQIQTVSNIQRTKQVSNQRTNNTVDVRSITINTQATDADGIAKDLGKGIKKELGDMQQSTQRGVRI